LAGPLPFGAGVAGRELRGGPDEKVRAGIVGVGEALAVVDGDESGQKLRESGVGGFGIVVDVAVS
jgi:hypothetical protein